MDCYDCDYRACLDGEDCPYTESAIADEIGDRAYHAAVDNALIEAAGGR